MTSLFTQHSRSRKDNRFVSPVISRRSKGPDETENDAYVARMNELLRAGCRIKLVQIYTMARPPAEVMVTPLENEAIDRIVERVRGLGLAAEGFYGPGQ